MHVQRLFKSSQTALSNNLLWPHDDWTWRIKLSGSCCCFMLSHNVFCCQVKILIWPKESVHWQLLKMFLMEWCTNVKSWYKRQKTTMETYDLLKVSFSNEVLSHLISQNGTNVLKLAMDLGKKTIIVATHLSCYPIKNESRQWLSALRFMTKSNKIGWIRRIVFHNFQWKSWHTASLC